VTQGSLYAATIEIQPANASEERRKLPSTVHTFAHQWLTLIAGERLAASTVVGVEHNDVLFLGQVVHSTPWGNDEWAIDIKVEQTLTGLQSLLTLRAQLEQDQTRSKNARMEEPMMCEVLGVGKNKAAKSCL
jgi:hypothetical protein